MRRSFVRTLPLLAVLVLGAACADNSQNNTPTVPSNPITTTETFEGALNKNGWSVTGAGKQSKNPGDSDAHVVRGADWSGFHFETNFRVDDGKSKPPTTSPDQSPSAAPAPASQPASGMMPFGPAPVMPGR